MTVTSTVVGTVSSCSLERARGGRVALADVGREDQHAPRAIGPRGALAVGVEGARCSSQGAGDRRREVETGLADPPSRRPGNCSGSSGAGSGTTEPGENAPDGDHDLPYPAARAAVSPGDRRGRGRGARPGRVVGGRCCGPGGERRRRARASSCRPRGPACPAGWPARCAASVGRRDRRYQAAPAGHLRRLRDRARPAPPRSSRRMLWSGIGFAHVAALAAPPLLSADVFGYLDFARLGVLHGLDPYTHTAAAAIARRDLPVPRLARRAHAVRAAVHAVHLRPRPARRGRGHLGAEGDRARWPAWPPSCSSGARRPGAATRRSGRPR